MQSDSILEIDMSGIKEFMEIYTSGGEINACACLGPIAGETLCPCAKQRQERENKAKADVVKDTYEMFGWAVIDKDGIEQNFISKTRHYFGSIEVRDDLDNKQEIIDSWDKNFGGMKPHSIIELYRKK